MKLLASGRVRFVALSVVIVALAAGGIAYAAIPDSSGVIHSCYAKVNGQLRVIDTGAGGGCTAGEKTLGWNQAGGKGFVSTGQSPGVPLGNAFTEAGTRLDLPAGKFIVNATLNFDNGGNPDANVAVRCVIASPSGTVVSRSEDVQFGPYGRVSPSAITSGGISLTGAIALDAPGTVGTICSASPEGAVANDAATMTATQVASLSIQSNFGP
jgi:hypothetical protein